MPMTLRSCGRDTVPITGPRSRALAAPQWIGKLCLAPGAGMRGKADMVNPIGTSHRNGPRNGDGPPKQTGLITNDAIR